MLGIASFGVFTMLGGCLEPPEDPVNERERRVKFELELANLGPAYPYVASGMFVASDGDSGSSSEGDTAALMPGQTESFAVKAAPGHRLSLAAAVGLDPSRALFVAFEPDGLPLFDAKTDPVAGDVTDSLHWWEVLPEGQVQTSDPLDLDLAGGPFVPRTVRRLHAGPVQVEPALPAVRDVLAVRVRPEDDTLVVEVTNVSSHDLSTPMSAGVWAIHGAKTRLFEPGTKIEPELEALALRSDPAPLAEALAEQTGVTPVLSAGVHAIHRGTPYLREGERASLGLEALAEDGDPQPLLGRLIDDLDCTQVGPFGVWAQGAGEPDALWPGDEVRIELTASADDRFSVLAADLQRNDDLIGLADGTLALFDAFGQPLEGDLTAELVRWDAGTEVDEPPGLGAAQGLRQVTPGHGYAQDGLLRRRGPDEADVPLDRILRLTLRVLEDEV